MKKTLIILVLLFSSSVLADDISDFQIEGMSVGDSLLDYFSEEEINDNVMHHYFKYKLDKKFMTVEFSRKPYLDKKLYPLSYYDILQVNIKPNDKKYKIYSIYGIIVFEDISKCYVKQKEIDKELSLLFKDTQRIDEGTWKHIADASNKSTVARISYNLVTEDYIHISCFDWSEETLKFDHLRIGIVTKEFSSWL